MTSDVERLEVLRERALAVLRECRELEMELLDRLKAMTESRSRQHAARALAVVCPYHGRTDCPDRWECDRLDAANEATWLRRRQP